MNLTLFTPTPLEGDPITLPDGTTTHAQLVSAVPDTGETIIVLGIAPRPANGPEGTTGGPLHGVITIDDLGVVTGTLDGIHACPYTAGDHIEAAA